jgi:hypothetical protein
VETTTSVELNDSVGLKMDAFGVIAGKKPKGLIQSIGMARK